LWASLKRKRNNSDTAARDKGQETECECRLARGANELKKQEKSVSLQQQGKNLLNGSSTVVLSRVLNTTTVCARGVSE
jgi:hypothetical protein